MRQPDGADGRYSDGEPRQHGARCAAGREHTAERRRAGAGAYAGNYKTRCELSSFV